MPAIRTKALVIGLGVTGRSAIRYLSAEGYDVYYTDTRNQACGRGTVAATWLAPDVAEATLQEFGVVIASPGVPHDQSLFKTARQLNVSLIGDVELFARAVTARVLAVTGTNGKSTVVSLLAAMAENAGLHTAAGANLGVPALDLIGPDIDLYVLELSSFQLELVESLTPAAAAVLNVSADHLDRYGSIEAYAQAKARVYRHAGIAVANRDDPRVMAMVKNHRATVTFGLNEPTNAKDYGVRDGHLVRGDVRLLSIDSIPLTGQHNLANVLAALALGDAIGLPMAAMLEAIHDYKALPHRMQHVTTRNGVRWIDDSKATNVSAAIAAVTGITAPLVVIAGGDGKGQDFSNFAQALLSRARGVVLMGRDAHKIDAALGGEIRTVYATSMQEAVAAAAIMAKPGDTVLLAPACSSLDQFTDYSARGTAFALAVEEFGDD